LSNLLLVRKLLSPTEYSEIPAYAGVIFAALIIYFPARTVTSLIFKNNKILDGTVTYNNERKNFFAISDYDRANPATQKKALKRWLDYREKLGQLTELEKKHLREIDVRSTLDFISNYVSQHDAIRQRDSRY